MSGPRRALFAAAILAAGVSVPAAKGAPRAHVVSASSPRDGGFVVERPGKSVTLTLRLSSGARVRRALVNGWAVSVAAVARGGRTRRLAVARRFLRRGQNVVVVEARSASGNVTQHAVVRFTLARPATGLVRAVSPAGGARLKPDPIQLRLSASAKTELRVWLNGRDASARLQMIRAGRFGADLSPRVGLRFGRNVVRVRALDPARGRVQYLRRVLYVSSSGPFADAGADVRVVAGRAVRLDSRASRQSPRAGAAGALRRRWKLIHAPLGAHATLRGATAVRPLLTATAPGTYTLSSTVSSGRVSSTDTVNVSVVPSSPVQPAAIPATQAGVTGIQLGPTFAPAPAGATGVQVVVVERSNLGLVSNTVYAPTDMPALLLALGAISNTDGDSVLVALTGLGTAPVAPSQSVVFTQALALIGAQSQSVTGVAVLGSPGFAAGNAWQSTSAALDGDLTLDSNGNWTFVYGDDVTYDTQAPPPAGVASRVTVGATNYDVPATSVGGFQVVTLNRQTLAGTSSFFPTASTASTPLQQMAQALQAARQAGDLLIVTSVGQPLASGAGLIYDFLWLTVLDELQGMGASSDTFAHLNLNPPNTYALVAPAAPGGQVAEASSLINSGGQAIGGGTGAINGVLSRDRQGDYAPTVNTYAGEPDLSLSTVAFQAPVPWPHTTERGGAAAYAYISTKLSLGCDAAGSCDVRSAYVNPALKNTWGAVPIASVKYPGGSPGFTKSDFKDVRAQLETEFADVTTVWNFLGDLSAPLTDTASQNYVDLQDIAATIETAVTPPPNASGTVAGFLSGLSDVLWIASAVVPGGGGLVLSAVAGALGLSDILSTDSAGNPIPVNVQDSADQLALQWADNTVAAAAEINNLAPIFVSDWGKLSRVAANVTGANGSWAISQQGLDAISTSLEQGATQTAYESLLPTAYLAYQLNPSQTNPNPVDASTYYCPQAFVPYGWAGEPEAGQAILFEPNSTTLYAMQTPAYPHPIGTNPPSSLVTPLFESVNQPGGVGLYQPYFWERYMLPPYKAITC